MRLLKRKLARKLIFVTALLSVIGVASLYSALLGFYRIGPHIDITGPIVIQLVAFFLGGVALYCMVIIPTEVLKRYAPYIFIATIAGSLLVFVPGLGVEENGAYRRIALFGLTFQPSELLKIGAVIFVASVGALSKRTRALSSHQILLLTLTLAVLTFFAFVQPDKGTFIVIVSALMAILIITPLHPRWYWFIPLIVIPLLFLLAFGKEYSSSRIQTQYNIFFGTLTQEELQNEAYQISQALQTIGSGGISGRGFTQGTQKFGFLPEATTDQIFSIFLEENGFVGGVLVVSLFLYLIYIGLLISVQAKTVFSSLLAIGIITLIGAQAFINMLIPLNLFPNTGIPLPFFSKGGTAIIGILIGIGILLRVVREGRGSE